MAFDERELAYVQADFLAFGGGEIWPRIEDAMWVRREREIPDEPLIVLADCELKHIDKGDPEVRGCAVALLKGGSWSMDVLDDPNHQIWDRAMQLRRMELLERAKGQEGMSVLYQLRNDIRSVVGTIASAVARRAAAIRPEKSLIGDLMKRIYSEMRKRFGSGVDNADEAGLRERRAWLKRLYVSIQSEGVPEWLR